MARSSQPEGNQGETNEEANQKEDAEIDPVANEFRNVADAAELRKLLMEGGTEWNSEELPSEHPKTLREALQGVHRVQATKEDLFDSLWRLDMYLRYWCPVFVGGV